MDLKIFRMHRLGLPQERIAKRFNIPQRTLSDHLAKMPSLAILLNADLLNHLLKMPELAKLVNTDLSKEFTVSQVAEKNHPCHFSNNSIAPQISKSPLWRLRRAWVNFLTSQGKAVYNSWQNS